jgi:Chs5-Arf1p-binding protein BUD7/BCH1
LKTISTFENVPFGELADFLTSRNEFEKAETFAIESLKSEPTKFSNWNRIVKIKIALKQPEKALVILNNAPMSTYSESDLFKTLPKPVLISLPGITATDAHALNISSTLSILEKLKSQNLKGTFKAAYELLIEIYKDIGWDELLDCRSKVFVMEKEYITDNTIVGNPASRESEDGAGVNATATAGEGAQNPNPILTTSQSSTEPQLKSPLNEPLSFPSIPSPHFLRSTRKKLCERWLDNLILILFEDLRIFSLYEEELRVKKEFGKGAKEWLLLGKLSMRLGHTVKMIKFYTTLSNKCFPI